MRKGPVLVPVQYIRTCTRYIPTTRRDTTRRSTDDVAPPPRFGNMTLSPCMRGEVVRYCTYSYSTVPGPYLVQHSTGTGTRYSKSTSTSCNPVPLFHQSLMLNADAETSTPARSHDSPSWPDYAQPNRGLFYRRPRRTKPVDESIQRCVLKRRQQVHFHPPQKF